MTNNTYFSKSGSLHHYIKKHVKSTLFTNKKTDCTSQGGLRAGRSRLRQEQREAAVRAARERASPRDSRVRGGCASATEQSARLSGG